MSNSIIAALSVRCEENVLEAGTETEMKDIGLSSTAVRGSLRSFSVIQERYRCVL